MPVAFSSPGRVSSPVSCPFRVCASGPAVGATRLAVIPAARFGEMLAAIPVLEARLIGVMTDRARETTRVEQQNENLGGASPPNR